MEIICHLSKGVARFLFVLVMVILFMKIIVPRTSVYFRYWMYYPKFGNYLNVYDVVLVSGEHFHLRVKNINQRLSYTSTDFKVAYANEFGQVTAYRPGTAYIEVKVREERLICRVKVIRLNHDEITLKIGHTKKLNVLGNWFFESYSSSDTKVAKVTKHGTVTAVASGTATITVRAKGKTMKCVVTVP